MEKKPESNGRVRQFFGFDPVEFVDDVVCATSFYINGLQESLSSLLSAESISQNRQNEIKTKLFSALQSSIDLNSDIFELYLMRNIFHIPVDADLTSELVSNSTKNIPIQSETSFSYDLEEEEELDSELRNLYQQIREEQEKRHSLQQSIFKHKINLQQTQEITKRSTQINNIIRSAQELPTQQIDELHDKLQKVYQKAKSFQSDFSDKQTLAFHQSAFSFD